MPFRVRVFASAAIAFSSLTVLAGCSLLPVDMLLPKLTCPDGRTPSNAELSPNLQASAKACIYDAVVAAVERDYVHTSDGFIERWRKMAEEKRALALATQDDDSFYKVLSGLVGAIGNGHTSLFPPRVAAQQVALYEGRSSVPSFGFISRTARDGVVVTAVIPGSPADREGLRRGDVITALDGRPCGSKCLQNFVGRAELTIRSGARVRTVALSTEPVTGFAPVEVTRIGPGGHVVLVTIPNFFTPNIAPDFRAKVTQALDEGRVSALIVDVRQNPGGMAEPLDEVLGSFLPSGTYGFHRTRTGERRDKTVRERDLLRRLKDVPLRVLVDGETHSAAELFAAMLQQQGRARMVGTPTAGVAEKITVYNLPGGSRLSVANAEFHTLDGTPVSKARVRPDIPSDPHWYDAAPQDDPGIRDALKSLR